MGSAEETKVTVISGFVGEYQWLSNFWLVRIEFEGLTYDSVEHAYQAAKTVISTERTRIWACSTPGRAKRSGRGVTLRSEWSDAFKLDIMRGLLGKKFSWPSLRSRLLSTGESTLIEKNTWGDRFWGVCGGRGENHLGRLLMEVRASIRIDG